MPDFLTIKIDTKDFDRLADIFQRAGKNVKPALARAINHTGGKARTQVMRALANRSEQNTVGLGASSGWCRRHREASSIGSLRRAASCR